MLPLQSCAHDLQLGKCGDDKLDHPVLSMTKILRLCYVWGRQKALMMEDEIVQKVLDEVKGTISKKPMYAAALFQ